MAKKRSLKRIQRNRENARSKRTSDEFLPSKVIAANNGFKAGQSYYVEGSRTRLLTSFTKWCGKPGSAFKRHENKKGYMVTPITDIRPSGGESQAGSLPSRPMLEGKK